MGPKITAGESLDVIHFGAKYKISVRYRLKLFNFVCMFSISYSNLTKGHELDPWHLLSITKTCPCNIYPLEPHFYIEKLGFKGVYLFFLFLLQNIDCGYSLEPPRRGGSNVYPQSMF